MIDDSMPELTIQDKLNCIAMFDDDKPGLILEGKTDVLIYRKLLTYCRNNFSNFDIIIGQCKKDILEFRRNDHDSFKYICIVDSDFDYYNNSEIADPRIIYTHFYTVENFLVDYDVVKKTYEELMVLGNNTDFNRIFEDIKESVKPFALLSFLKNKQKWDIEVEHCSIHNKLWGDFDHNLCLSLQSVEEYMLRKLQDHGYIIMDNVNWGQVETEFNIALEQYDYNCLVKGKQLFQAVFVYFKKYLPHQMSKINESSLRTILCSKIRFSRSANDLINRIDICFNSEIAEIG